MYMYIRPLTATTSSGLSRETVVDRAHAGEQPIMGWHGRTKRRNIRFHQRSRGSFLIPLPAAVTSMTRTSANRIEADASDVVGALGCEWRAMSVAATSTFPLAGELTCLAETPLPGVSFRWLGGGRPWAESDWPCCPCCPCCPTGVSPYRGGVGVWRRMLCLAVRMQNSYLGSQGLPMYPVRGSDAHVTSPPAHVCADSVQKAAVTRNPRADRPASISAEAHPQWSGDLKSAGIQLSLPSPRLCFLPRQHGGPQCAPVCCGGDLSVLALVCADLPTARSMSYLWMRLSS